MIVEFLINVLAVSNGNVLNEEVLAQSIDNAIFWIKSFLATVGGVFLIYLIFNVINSIISKKKYKELSMINERLKNIEELLRKNLKK